MKFVFEIKVWSLFPVPGEWKYEGDERLYVSNEPNMIGTN